MGEMMKDTPKDQISKVFLEEKLFTTWHGGRTVLIGDGKWTLYDMLSDRVNASSSTKALDVLLARSHLMLKR